MGVVTKGGAKRRFKEKGRRPVEKSIQDYLRRQVRSGKGHDATGASADFSKSQMGPDLLAGYNLKR